MIRRETAGDHAAIDRLLRDAFAGPGEAALVAALRRSGDAVLGLVAEREDAVLGHVLFSRLDAPMPALSLAPLAVLPQEQDRGVGSALVRAGFDLARREGWHAVFVLGDPAYYTRFGFDVAAARGFDTPYAGEHFMIGRLTDAPMPATDRIAYPAPFLAL